MPGVPFELGFSFANTPISGSDAYTDGYARSDLTSPFWSDGGGNSAANGLNGMWDFGDVVFGSDGVGGTMAGGSTPITGLVRDIAVGVAVALLAKYLWGKIR